MNDADPLLARVESFPRWHYEIDLGEVRTPIENPSHANRHAQRKEYFFAPLVQLCGGSLKGKRVLDLGCNAGYWALAAMEAGADFVLGIDGRQMHVDQANLVFEAKGIEASRYRFELGDIYALDLKEETFDIVLCLGLLYHVRKPFELMERIAAWNTDLLVIDTTLDTHVRGPYFRVVGQKVDDPRSSLDRPVALHPTGEAVLSIARLHGYAAVMMRPRFTDWTASKRYRNGSRRAFMCAKKTALTLIEQDHPTVRSTPRAEPAAREAAPGTAAQAWRARAKGMRERLLAAVRRVGR